MTKHSDVIDDHVFDDSIDLMSHILGLFSKWKLILTITVLSAVVSIIVALSSTKVFVVDSQLSPPSLSDVLRVNQVSINNYERKELFANFVELLSSDTNFQEFLIEKGYLNRLFENDGKNTANDNLYIFLARESMIIEYLNPSFDNGSSDESGRIRNIKLSYQHTDENLSAELLQEYLEFVNEKSKEKLADYEFRSVHEKLETINKKKAYLVRLEKEKRLLEIERLKNERDIKLNELFKKRSSVEEKYKKDLKAEVANLEIENAIKLKQLYLKRDLLIEKARKDRELEIAVLKEKNREKIKELEQQRELLVFVANENKDVTIARAEEALKISSSMGIEYPSTLSSFSGRTSVKTEIDVNSDNSLPLYLMGQKYLKALLSVLRKREDEERLIEKINEIDSEIQKLLNDTKLEMLKSRTDDSLYVEELSQIELEIELVKNDPRIQVLKDQMNKENELFLKQLNDIDFEIELVRNNSKLKALENRESDIPFIEGYPELQESANEVKDLSLDYSDVNFYSLTSAPYPRGKVIKPNKKLIVILGTLIGGFFAVLIAVFMLAYDKRRDAQLTNSNEKVAC